MHISELQLIGFKSFQDKAVLRFSPGINAIVGPNGCGKTNVLDALRWVLGEQSFSLLRCGRTEDVVFGGTATAPPTNYAEVKLVLAADDPAEPAAEIEIRRRYFRSGESEYFLNRQPCRLKDIQEVFLSSGTGTRAYSIFDLRQMREIISGNIRKLFEEAATLAKYQDAKDECQRKLALTESDLTRLDDIIVERERLVRSLARQAARLRAHSRLRAEENDLKLAALKQEYDELVREQARVQADADGLEQAASARVADIHQLDDALKTQRAKLRDLQASRDEAAGRLLEQRRTVAELDGKILLARQRIDFLAAAADRAEQERRALLESVTRLEQAFAGTLVRLAEANEQVAREQQALEAERASTRAGEDRLYNLKNHDAALQHQLKELLEQQAELNAERARREALEENRTEEQARLAEELLALDARLTEARAGLDKIDSTRAALQENVAANCRRSETLRTELASVQQRLKETQRGLARLNQERVRREKELAVLRSWARAEQSEVCRTVLGDTLLGNVSQFMQIRTGWERAFEAALYAVADFLVTTGSAGSERLAALAEARPDLSFGFLPLDTGQRKEDDPSARAEEAGVDRGLTTGGLEPPEDDAVVAPLAQYVEFDPLTPEPLRAMVRRCQVVAGAADLERLGPAHPGWTFVTRDGWCRFSDGRLVLAGSGPGRLGSVRLGDEHVRRLAETDTAQARLTGDEVGLTARRDELENDLGVREVEVGDLERQAHTQDALRSALAAQIDELERERGRLQARVQSPLSKSQSPESSVQVRLAETASRVEATGALLEQSGRDVAAQEHLVRAGLERSAELLADLSRARETGSRLETESAFAKRQIDEARRRIVELELAAAQHHEEVAALERESADRTLEMEHARSQLARLEAELQQMQFSDLVKAEEELDRNLAELRTGQEQQQTLLLDQRLKLRELALRLAAIADEARTAGGTDIARFEPEQLPDATARLVGLRQRLLALGQVNPLAGDDYNREKQDLVKLRQQREDVGAARVNLEQTMAEIDRHARDQFLSTYAAVRTEFQQVFKELFLEGEADLVLVNDTNPLESEIAITAKPRGKNPKRLEQLSDGEKAMLAISLLFAFYRVKPAPFCFLDEVDAPLDDANAARFANYLRRIAGTTQVVIITHNRLTVERADVVFGVTAEEPGISKLISVRLAGYRTAEPEPAPA